MKQLLCEMCGGVDLVKDGGVFVCQTCGTKYSVEEAKKMMVEGTVDVTGTVKIDNTAQIQNYLDLSKNAYDSGNGQSAFDYANKALEIAPQNHKAWICKMMAIEYMGTLGELKLMEVVEAGKNAVTYAPEEEKDDIEVEVYGYELTRALSLLKLAMNKMSDDADIRRTYKTFLAISLLTASKNTMEADSGIVNLYDNIANEALSLALLVPDDVLGRHLALAKLVGECAKQYQYETDALSKRYSIYGATLTASAKSTRESNKKKLSDKAEKASKLAKEYEEKEAAAKREKEAQEKAERLEIYWSEHASEKIELEAEKSRLESQVASMQSQVDDINKKRTAGIDELRKVRDAKVPEEIECDKQADLIRDLEHQRSKCGIFKGKEKKEIQERIDQENIRLEDMRKNAQTAADKHKADINAQISDIQHTGQDILDEFNKLKARIQEIVSELTKDR